MAETADPQREFLRHILATLAYRAGKTLRGAPDAFSDFAPGKTSRTPIQILAHIGDLLDWALSMAQGKPAWHNSKPKPWSAEVDRFYAALKALDDYLASPQELRVPAAQMFQGPMADALTHTGQLAMLRRIAGVPVRGENYYVAEIVIGRVGSNQPPPRREFD